MIKRLVFNIVCFLTIYSACGQDTPYWKVFNHTNYKVDSTEEAILVPTHTGTLIKSDEKNKFTPIYIVSSSDIINHNYFTLCDVLRDIPGFSVSQPGNSLQGEFFTYNGMNGNEHFLIMVNGIQQSTPFIKGLPISVNLPIRQAQRIEIDLNPIAFAGNQSILGSINIITPQTERPTFVKASLNGLSNLINNINLIVGGKIAIKKQILKFDFYANYFENRSISFYNNSQLLDSFENIYNKKFPYQTSNNYSQTLNASSDLIASGGSLSGVNLYFRSWHLNYAIWNRKNRFGIGFTPLAFVNKIANHYYADNFQYVNLRTEKNKKIRSYNYSFFISIYNADNSNSAMPIFPDLKQKAFNFGENLIIQNKPNPDSARAWVNRNISKLDQEYFGNIRFFNSYGNELKIDLSENYTIGNFSLFVGAKIKSLIGQPLQYFLPKKATNLTLSLDSLPHNLESIIFLANINAQFNFGGSFTYKNWTIINRNSLVSVQYFPHAKIYHNLQGGFYPNIYIKKTLNNKILYANYNTGFTQQSQFDLASNYNLIKGNIQNGATVIEKHYVNNLPINSKQLSVGFSGDYFKNSFNLAIKYNTLKNIPQYAYYDDQGNIGDSLNLRYHNYGIINNPKMKRNMLITEYGTEFPFELTWGESFKTKMLMGIAWYKIWRITNTFAPLYNTNKKAYFSSPSQFKLFWQIKVKQKLTIKTILRRNTSYRNQYANENVVPIIWIIDLMGTYKLNRNFFVTLRWNNIASKNIIGPSSFNNGDDPVFNYSRNARAFLTLSYALD